MPTLQPSVDFVPFDQPQPETGATLHFEVANPDYAEELAGYRAALERNPFAENDVIETLTARC